MLSLRVSDGTIHPWTNARSIEMTRLVTPPDLLLPQRPQPLRLDVCFSGKPFPHVAARAERMPTRELRGSRRCGGSLL